MSASTGESQSGESRVASSIPNKRKSRSSPSTQGSISEEDPEPAKRLKGVSSSPTSLGDKLVDLMTNFNLCVNELFQLKEYGSLVEWNPTDFSKVIKPDLPEIFDYFINENGYKLIWDEQSAESLDDLPLRLQKKKLLEREQMLRKKYPFMDDTLARSNEREGFLLEPIREKKNSVVLNGNKSNGISSTRKPAGAFARNAQSSKRSSLTKLEISEEPSSDYSDVDTNYKLRSISFSLPPPVITHPSHIPSWRPGTGAQNLQASSESEGKILEFDSSRLRIISSKQEEFSVPKVEDRIRDFITTKYKAGIIDDNGIEVANTPEEYNSTLASQLHLLKRLYSKVMIEGRFELNGDKIERRKTMLPNTSSKISSDYFRENGSIVPKIQGTANDQTFQDHLVSQGMMFSKIHHSMRRQHQARIRRIAQIIEQHFRKKAGEKERLEREREQNLRRLSRLAVQSVRKRWSQAYKVYRHIQNEKMEELKQIEGREHLSKMLEHSTQLLEAQLNRPSTKSTDIESSDNESDDADSDDRDSENFSSSSESEYDRGDEASNENDILDSQLSVDELRKKYADLQPSSVDQTEMEGSESETENRVQGNGFGSLASLYGAIDNNTVTKESNGYSAAELELIQKSEEQNEHSMPDSDSASDSMDESDESISDDISESSSENESSSEQQGLASLYGGTSNNDLLVSESRETKDDEDENVQEINGLKVKDVPIPQLLRGTLRPYQKQGLNWLASLYMNDTNGILADEMGLGKTIQTISLLAYLACEHHIWGPHLIIVPTSVMLNWEMEFKKFAPGFKVLTYYGSPQERARKRKGWNKQDAFHVCITSYQLVVHDHSSFKRKKWRYMILDEAHNIKNFRSNRWKALLNFNTENRLLLTGTPLQNNLMELWSLLYFLMPSSKVEQMMPEGFANFEDFQQWFGKPVDKILEKTATGDLIDDDVTSKLDQETKDTVARLHQVLRPYLLRRLKKDVEKQMPGKYEHIVYCRLSKRQRYLYDDFMSRAKTKETLASGNFLSIINCLMQLRKVCNHPDLFEVRPIVTSFAMPKAVSNEYNSTNQIVTKLLADSERDQLPLKFFNFDISNTDGINYFAAEASSRLMSNKDLENQIEQLDQIIKEGTESISGASEENIFGDILQVNRFLKLEDQIQLKEHLKQAIYVNTLRCERRPLYGASFLKSVSKIVHGLNESVIFGDLIKSIPSRQESLEDVVNKYAVVTPPVVALDMCDQLIPLSTQVKIRDEVQQNEIPNPFHQAQVKLSIAFPDKQLLQYDCGKLQKLASLLQELVPNGHRALIFTQMTKVLDILEQFLNIHGYRYMRLDGATKIEDRQLLTEKFNRDPKIPVFILSTRSGGLGINLTGADTVIFYDSDWNPAMDKQCQDRCHRIGQSRDVHIYRFVSEYTIESNILKKANQKRQLDNVVIQEGDFTTDYLGKFSVRDLVNDTSIIGEIPDKPIGESGNLELLAQAEDEADRNAAKEAMKEVAVDDEDFNEDSKQGTPGFSKEEKEEGDDADYDEGVGHIDEYMLRSIADGYYVE